MSNGIGLTGATFIAFLVLKLTGVIAWSWWWITAPLWGPVVLFLLGFVVYVIVEWVKDRRKVARQKRVRENLRAKREEQARAGRRT